MDKPLKRRGHTLLASSQVSFLILLLLSLLICANSSNHTTSQLADADEGAPIERFSAREDVKSRANDDSLFLANDQLNIQFQAKSPSSQMTFNTTTYVGSAFYTNVVWSQLSEGDRQWPIPADFAFNKTIVPNSYGNGTLLQRITFNATVNNGSMLLADVYLTNEAVNVTLTSSFNSSAPSFTSYAPLNLPAPTKVPSRFLHSTPENSSITVQLGPSALLVKLRVLNWHYASTRNKLTISGNVKSSASGLDVFWSKYPPPTNNLELVGLPGGPKIIVVHLLNNATVGCDGQIKSVYVDTRYDIRSILSPVSADIRLIFPALAESFFCFNASNHSVPCACNETFIDFVVYMELDKWETIIRWWLIAGIIVLAVAAFMVLIFIFLGVARWYNRVLKEDKEKEREAKMERKREQGKAREDLELAGQPTDAATNPAAQTAEEPTPKKKRTWRRKEELGSEEETDPLLRFVYKKKTI